MDSTIFLQTFSHLSLLDIKHVILRRGGQIDSPPPASPGFQVPIAEIWFFLLNFIKILKT